MSPHLPSTRRGPALGAAVATGAALVLFLAGVFLLVRATAPGAQAERRVMKHTVGIDLVEAPSALSIPLFLLSDTEVGGGAWTSQGTGQEAYDVVRENPFQAVRRQPLSTFGLDVDTASYANVRRFLLQQGALPPRGAVRLEELVNALDYGYREPADDAPLAFHVVQSPCPWAPAHRLLRIAVQGRRVAPEALPPRNLVFLVDVSGSMEAENKLPLVKQGLGYLVDQLRPADRVALVVYAGSSGLVLPPTSGADRDRIRKALASLESGGSTQGSEGIRLAYEVARRHFQKDAINRVILATDGDFNVGVTSQDELVQLIERERRSGVFLSVVGFGCGNLKDSTLVKLADTGNGHYAYIDSLQEARRVFRDGGATLVTLAKDVKLQVEFNPARVTHYRLLGYEKRLLAAEDFHDDRKDAGELGVGHAVTALYELVPPGVPLRERPVEALKYQRTEPTALAGGSELLTLTCRYKAPDQDRSQLLRQTVEDRVEAEPGEDVRLAAGVATFALVLTGSEHRGSATHALAESLVRGALGSDPRGERRELLSLIQRARVLADRGKPATEVP